MPFKDYCVKLSLTFYDCGLFLQKMKKMTSSVEFSKEISELIKPNAIVWLQDEVNFKVKSIIKSAWFKR